MVWDNNQLKIKLFFKNVKVKYLTPYQILNKKLLKLLIILKLISKYL